MTRLAQFLLKIAAAFVAIAILAALDGEWERQRIEAAYYQDMDSNSECGQ